MTDQDITICPICKARLRCTNFDTFQHIFYPQKYHKKDESTDPYEIGKKMAEESLERMRKQNG